MSLTLSDDSAVESILTDIPFFTVGIMTFGISTFLLIMKRVSLLGLCLYFSALLAFVASIFDLSQILARGSSSVSSGAGIDAVRGLVNTREVALALSLGFRYIFYWAFVSERPQNEPLPFRKSESYIPRYHAHSNSWQRWGYLGFILKWGLLGLTVAIPTLQIIWRIAQREFGVIYMVESTMEIVVSSLFILKLFLNIYLSTERPWWRPLVSYVAPIGALSISLGLGVGQLILFDLSDTTLGHFLQAIELYIVIVYMLVIIFLPVRRPMRPPRSPTLPMQTQVGRDEKEGLSGLPRPVTMPGPTEPGDDSPEIAVVDRNTNFIFDIKPYRPPSIVKPYTPPNVTEPVERDLESGNYAIYDDGNEPNDSDRNRIQIVTTPAEADDAVGTVVEPSQRSTSLSVSSYYYMQEQERPPSIPLLPPSFSRPGNDSPVYGLNGIIGAESGSRPDSGVSFQRTVGTGTARTSETSFNELLRQQNELDKSIAALRLFSPDPSSESFPKASEAEPSTAKPSSHPYSVAASSSSGRKADTSSARSEFSLSVFPEPPVLNRPVSSFGPLEETSTTLPISRFIPADVSASHKDSFVSSIPTSPNSIWPGHERYDSAGTQYDVTSFIGDLTDPALRGQRTGSVFKGAAAELSDVESGDESPVIVTATPAVARSANAVILGSATPSLTALPPRQDDGPEDESENDKFAPSLRPFLLGNVTSSPAVSSPLSGTPLSAPYVSRNPPVVGPRRPIPGRSGLSGTYRPRLKISAPRRTSEGLYPPGAYERPRPPPLIISGNLPEPAYNEDSKG
ncbi:hypothetical protein BDZ89DRAFT_1058937 [Hymenopellis radicata]|nr:hypothetical protein BDZ89DRAFT_1058937 [Hymenopellis radicata]